MHAGRASELLELHAGLDVPAGRMSVTQAVSLAGVEFDVAFLAGLPDDAAQLAERRVSMLLRQHDLGPAEPLACLTLALLRLRQGGPGNCAEAERFCDQALTAKEIRDSGRRIALAAVIGRGSPADDDKPP